MMDLGLSNIIHREERTYVKGGVKVKQVRQISVGGAIVMSILTVGVIMVFKFKGKNGTIADGVMGTADWMLSWATTLLTAVGSALDQLLPDLPNLPSPGKTMERVAGYIPDWIPDIPFL